MCRLTHSPNNAAADTYDSDADAAAFDGDARGEYGRLEETVGWVSIGELPLSVVVGAAVPAAVCGLKVLCAPK